MDKKELIGSILSGTTETKALAKATLKEMLSARAESLKSDAQKFVTKKLFESSYDSQQGPFPAGMKVTDVQRGVVGTVHLDPHNSEHPVQVHAEDGVKYHYGPDDIKNLVKHEPEMSAIIDMIAGKKGD